MSVTRICSTLLHLMCNVDINLIHKTSICVGELQFVFDPWFCVINISVYCIKKQSFCHFLEQAQYESYYKMWKGYNICQDLLLHNITPNKQTVAQYSQMFMFSKVEYWNSFPWVVKRLSEAKKKQLWNQQPTNNNVAKRTRAVKRNL